MWNTEHSADAVLAPERVWRAWVEVDHWPRWNADIERIALHGPFAVGSLIATTPKGQDTVELRIAEVVEGESFVDEAEVADTVVRTIHRIERLDGERVRIVYHLQADGPAADQVGPAVSADFAETIKALIQYAAS